MKPNLKPLKLAAWMLLGSILMPMPSAYGSGQSILAWESDDITIALAEVAGGTATDFDLRLIRVADFNADGDYDDLNERTDIFSVSDQTTCTNAAVSPHMSCDLFDFGLERAYFTWRNASSQHVAGNYTFLVTWRDTLNSVVAVSFIGIQIREGIAPNVAETAAIRARVNATNCLENHCTDFISTRINETGATLISEIETSRFRIGCVLGYNLTLALCTQADIIPTNPVLNDTVYQLLTNISQGNATVDFSPIAEECGHGSSSLCLNSHTTTFADNGLVQAVILMVAALGALGLAVAFPALGLGAAILIVVASIGLNAGLPITLFAFVVLLATLLVIVSRKPNRRRSGFF